MSPCEHFLLSGSSSLSDTYECAKQEKHVLFLTHIQWHSLSQTLHGHLCFLIWHLFWSLGQFGAGNNLSLQASGGTTCSAKSRARVYMNISPVEPEPNWDLRRSFKKCVCITDDLLEEITNQIWPALQCTSLMSVQLGWLLCFEWQECTHRQEEPDSPQLHVVFGELSSLFSWKIMLFPPLVCVNGVRILFVCLFV